VQTLDGVMTTRAGAARRAAASSAVTVTAPDHLAASSADGPEETFEHRRPRIKLKFSKHGVGSQVI
jgi:hypothetical protein